MPSEREQRVRAAIAVFEESVRHAFVMARPESSRQDPMILREDAREYLVAIACEPEAAPDAAEIDAWHRRMVDQYERFGFTRKTYHALVLEGIALMRRAQPATANELAIRELEALATRFRDFGTFKPMPATRREFMGKEMADRADVDDQLRCATWRDAAWCVEQRLAALRQPAPAKEKQS